VGDQNTMSQSAAQQPTEWLTGKPSIVAFRKELRTNEDLTQPRGGILKRAQDRGPSHFVYGFGSGGW
jgi:hypothetical protein